MCPLITSYSICSQMKILIWNSQPDVVCAHCSCFDALLSEKPSPLYSPRPARSRASLIPACKRFTCSQAEVCVGGLYDSTPVILFQKRDRKRVTLKVNISDNSHVFSLWCFYFAMCFNVDSGRSLDSAYLLNRPTVFYCVPNKKRKTDQCSSPCVNIKPRAPCGRHSLQFQRAQRAQFVMWMLWFVLSTG